MSIWNIFTQGSKGQGQGQQPATTTPPQVAANPTVPSEASPGPKGNASPVDKYTKLWELDTGAPAAPSLVPNFNLDPEKLREAASKLDFSGHIPEETLSKAVNGDIAAFKDVLNKAVQLGFAQATSAAGEISKNHFTSAQGVLKEQILPQAIRQTQVTEALSIENNPAFKDPSVAPMLSMVASQLQTKYPTAPANEIATMAKEYLSQFAAKVSGVSAPTVVAPGRSKQPAQVQTDWGEFFELATGKN